MAKKIIERKGFIIVPHFKISLSKDLRAYLTEIDLEQPPEINNIPNYLNVRTSRFDLYFNKIYIEKNDNQIRPDIQIWIKDKKLCVEIAYTHFVENEKIIKIKKDNLDVVEYNLSNLSKQSSEKDIENALYSTCPDVWWINNEKLNNNIQHRMRQAIEIRDYIWEHSDLKKTYGNLKKVYKCPENMEKGWADIKEDCYQCDYFMEVINDTNYAKENFMAELNELGVSKENIHFLSEKYGKQIHFKNGSVQCAGNIKNQFVKLVDTFNSKLY